MYFPFALWIERPQTALYHRKLNFLSEWCGSGASQKKTPKDSTRSYSLWCLTFRDVPLTRHYHKKLLAGGFSLDAFGSMWHTEQALTRDKLAGGLTDAVGLVLDAHESHLEVADELCLALCE